MSYRNPQIIQDRSGEILAKGFENFGASIAQGINTLGAQRRKEREKRDAENKLLGEKMIELGNKKAQDAAAFNKGIKNLSKSMREQMTVANNANLDRIYEIKKAQLYGDANPELSEELAVLLGKTNTYNSLAESMLGSIPILSEMVDNWPKAGRTEFFTEGKDGTTAESKAFVMGIGGAEGFEAGMNYKEDGELVAWAKDDQGNYYEINAEDFPGRSDGFTITAPDAVGDQIAAQDKLIYDESGEKFLTSLTADQEKEYVLEPGVNDKGLKVSYNKQYLNSKEIQGAVSKLAKSNLIALQQENDNKQVQQHLLDKFLIDLTADEFRDLDENEQQEVVNKPTKDLFFDGTEITEEVDENGEPTGRFYREEDRDEFKPPAGSKDDKSGYKFAAQYTDDQINKMVSDVIGKVEEAETVNITDLLNISSGMEALSGPKYNVNVIEGKVKEGTGTEDVPAVIEDSNTYITITESLPGDNKDLVNVYDITNASSLTNLILRTQGYGTKNKAKARKIANAIIAKQ